MTEHHRLSVYVQTVDDADLDEILSHLASHQDVNEVGCGHEEYDGE